jgi:hypothetical protein
MITKANYFEKVKQIAFSKLPDNLKKGFLFLQQTTDDYTTWKFYNDYTDIKVKVDKYFSLLNDFLIDLQNGNQNGNQNRSHNEGTEKTDESLAKSYAKDLIRAYVLRGDTLAHLAKSHLGHASQQYHAEITQNKIVLHKIDTQKVNISFSLKSIYNEILSTEKKKTSSISAAKRGRNKKPSIKPSIKPIINARPNPRPNPKPNQTAMPNPPKRNKPIKIDYKNSKPFERIEDEIKFIKRFLSLHGKSKSKAQILSFLNALQRAILEKRIRKTSKFATDIMQIQKQLHTAYKSMQGEPVFELSEPAIERLSKIVGSVRVRQSTQYLKRFVSIQGKNITKDKAKRLLEVLLNAIQSETILKSDPYFENCNEVIASLEQFIKLAKQDETLEIHKQTLNGLNGALGCDCCTIDKSDKRNKNEVNGLVGIEGTDGLAAADLNGTVLEESPQVMSVEDVKQKKYNAVPLSEKWKRLLGDICLPTHLFVYGNGGSGKSSFALLFTQHLATLGYKILYIAGEQFDTPPFTKLLNQLNIIAGDNYTIVGKLETLNPSDFDFVVLDTKDSLQLDTMDFLKLKEQYKSQSFIIVSHGIKTGEFKGKEQWRNIVDVMVHGEHGTITTGQDKNRWGGSGQMLIYDHPEQYLIKE